MNRSSRLLLLLDLTGTFVFAVEGATNVVPANLDIFGVMVVAFASALAGGILRDVLIGDVPPMAFHDARYGIAAVAGALLVFVVSPLRAMPAWLVLTLDAGGLALFSMSGSFKAEVRGVNAYGATLLGTLTAVGGGFVANILLARVDPLLQTQIYASAALLGSATMLLGVRHGLPRAPMLVIGGGVCFMVRILSLWQGWNLPRLGPGN